MPESVRSLGFRVWEGSPAVMRRGHAHLDVEVNYVLAGGMTYRLGDGRHVLGAGSLTAFWAALPHRLEAVAAGTRCLWITAPVAWFLEPSLPRSGLGDLLGGRLLRAVRPGEAPRLRAWAAELEGGDPGVARAVGLEVHAYLLRLGLADRPAHTTPAHAPRDHVETMIEVMARRFSEPLDIAAIAKSTGLHPRWAMRVFKEAVGVTIWEYLLRLRVAHAQHLLLEPGASVLDAALASGFGSPARFYATFRRLVGTSPGTWRSSTQVPDQP